MLTSNFPMCVGRSYGCRMEGVPLGYTTRTCSFVGPLSITFHEIFFASFTGIGEMHRNIVYEIFNPYNLCGGNIHSILCAGWIIFS